VYDQGYDEEGYDIGQDEEGYDQGNNHGEVAEVAHCPRGHALVAFAAPNDRHGCDGCKACGLPEGSPLLGCRACDFDLCAACAHKKQDYGHEQQSKKRQHPGLQLQNSQQLQQQRQQQNSSQQRHLSEVGREADDEAVVDATPRTSYTPGQTPRSSAGKQQGSNNYTWSLNREMGDKTAGQSAGQAAAGKAAVLPRAEWDGVVPALDIPRGAPLPKWGFVVGQRVEARFGSKGPYYTGHVIDVNSSDGSYTVGFDDGDSEPGLKEPHLRSSTATYAPPPARHGTAGFVVGARVEAQFGSRGSYYPGRVVAVHGDGS
jgi:hypothetical protein